jgi:hypothetical protein
MSCRVEPSLGAILWISMLGGLLLVKCLVVEVPMGDGPHDGRPEVSALAGLPGCPIVLPDAIIPPSIALCKEPCVPRRDQACTGDGPPSSAYMQCPTARAPPWVFILHTFAMVRWLLWGKFSITGGRGS